MKSKPLFSHPASLYFLLMLVAMLCSWIAASYGVRVAHPQTGELIEVHSLMSPEGMRWLLRNLFDHFTSFKPLGLVLVGLLGLGIAQHSGFLDSLMQLILQFRPRPQLIIMMVIWIGMLSNVIGDVGYLFLLPLSAKVFQAVRLSPVAGLITSYVSVACAYSANMLMGTMDPIMANTTALALEQAGISTYTSGPMSNYWFMSASFIVLSFVIYQVTVRLLMPQLPSVGVDIKEVHTPTDKLAPYEVRALRAAGITGVVYVIILVLAAVLPNGFLQGVDGSLLRSPMIQSALFLVTFGLGLCGMAYGFVVGKYRNDRDLFDGMTYYTKLLGAFLVLAFFAAQLFACLQFSQLDKYLAVVSAQWMTGLSFGHHATLIIFILFCAVLNILMVSATGKWAFVAYIFVPALAAQGIAPEITQCAYRIGDSATNGLTPLLYYIPLVLMFLQQYQPDAGFGRIISYTWKYSVAILVAWIVLFMCWLGLGIPLGM